ncbi:MAG: hypothetical protein MJ062_01950 [Oscillospiraceae bacterium]|nr:hypothetical protein [Oscillospiraceae bacterium]
MKFTCPICGEKTFSPLLKARAGGMSSSGAHCPSCGGRCVNGKLNLIVNSVTSGIACIMVFVTYFLHTNKTQLFLFAFLPIVIALVFNFVFNMFFGKLTEAIKHE